MIRYKMNDEHLVEDIITKFLLNTCRLSPQLSTPAVQAATRCVMIGSGEPLYDQEASVIPLATGSVAEFYIEPMLPQIGDIDVMYYHSYILAIPRGHKPPAQLPSEFHNYVKVFEIITDSYLPGYVYLQLRHLLNYVDDGKYTAVEDNSHSYLSNRLYTHSGECFRPTHGPAFSLEFGLALPDDFVLPDDVVRCVRCLVWPSQAADWPSRHRNHGWPDSATVDRVVGNGCDVVGVAHRLCKEHKWMGEYQWRLSFSRAEIVLINSWMPVQQIVYHILRVFMKLELLTDSADNSGAGTLSNYHIKTLMLWACELKSRTWWTDDLNLVRICVQLLHILSDWLADARCQHYFISNCNLIDNSYNVTNIRIQVMSIDETWLSEWFVRKYMRKCSELCSDSVSRLFDDVSTSAKLLNAVSSAIVWRQNSTLLDLWCVLHYAQFNIPWCVYVNSLTVRSCACWVNELAKMDSRFSVYFTAVAFQHVAHRSLKHGLNDELMDISAMLLSPFIRRRRCYNNSTSLLTLDKAAKLMKFVANKSLGTMSLIAIELSKAYLYRALSCEDSNDSIYCLANVYLAVLYYITGQYRKTTDHCTLVTRSQNHSQCSSHVVQGELLPKIDDDIGNVLGLAVFYQYLRATASNQQHQIQHVGVLTTELFAYYLNIKCLPLTTCCLFTPISPIDEFRRYEICISDTVQLFIGDVLLLASLKQKSYHKPVSQQSRQLTTNPTGHRTLHLVELLQKSAVEHLTNFVTSRRANLALQSRLSQQTLRRCTRTNVATISGVCSCLHRTYTRC